MTDFVLNFCTTVNANQFKKKIFSFFKNALFSGCWKFLENGKDFEISKFVKICNLAINFGTILYVTKSAIIFKIAQF